MALIGVNAIACGALGPRGPEREARLWTQPVGAADRAPSALEVVAAEPSSVWRAGLSKPPGGAPAVGATVIAVSTSDRWLTVLDRATGERIWRERLDGAGIGDVLIAGDRVYAAATGPHGGVAAYALRDGDQRWHRELGRVAGIMLDEAHVYVTTDDGRVMALDADRGAVRWQRRLGEPVRSAPLVVPSGLLVATFDSLYVLDRADGGIRTRAAAPAPVLATPARAGDLLVFGSPAGRVAAVDLADLSERWHVATSGEVVGGVAVARDTVFTVTSGGVLYRIPLATPAAYDTVMLTAAVIALPTPVANGVLVGGAGGEMLFVGRQAPEGRTLFRLDGPIEHPAVVLDGTIYVTNGRGRLEAWR